MILVVDDEQIHLELVVGALATEGYEVKAFPSAIKALEYVTHVAPQLIISDINMPELDGFQFYQHYQQRYSHRQTPFVFLTSHSDPETIVKGLNSGADDYLQKPLLPEIIRAKVHSILQRRKKYISQKYTGNLAQMDFFEVLKFCELKRLTGWVVISSENYTTTINFAGGEPQVDGSTEDFDAVFDLTEGYFTINVQQVDYSDLLPENQQAEGITVDNEKPIGKLSGIKVQKRLFQIQTELAEQSDGQIVTIVVLDGRVVLKRVSRVSLLLGRQEIEKSIETQHLSVEEEVRTKIASLLEKKGQPESSGKVSFHQLYDAGFDKYREGDFSAALELWEEAEKINPRDKTLTINLNVVRKKLAEEG